MTHSYHEARNIIKKHVNAGGEDSLFIVGFGMTAAVREHMVIFCFPLMRKLR